MPQYTFRCSKKKCLHEFQEICSFKEFDEGFSQVKCPRCGKAKPNKVFELNQVHFGNNPDKMNNFEYAAKKNFDKAQIESFTAKEEAKKTGVRSPYGDLPDFTDNGRRMNFTD